MKTLSVRPATALIVAGNLCIVLPLAAILNVWQDEAYSFLTTTGSLAHTVHQAIMFEQNAPLYFILLWFWRHVSAGYFWARLLSVLCTTAMIALVPGLVRRYAPQISPVWVTLVVAFNPLTIWAAVEVRSYALAMLLGALLLRAGYDAFIKSEARPADLLVFTIAAALGAYTQYFLLFIVAGYGIVLFAMRAWKALGRYVLACGGIMLLFIPMLIVLPSQMAAFRTAYTPPASILQSFKQLATIFFFQLVPISTMSHRRAITIVVLVLVAAALILGRRSFGTKGTFLALGVLVSSAVVYAVAVYVLGTHFDYRYGAFLFVPLVVAIFSIFDWWKEPARRHGVAALAVLLLAISVASLVNIYRVGAKIGDWRRVSTYLDANVRDATPIFVFEAENAVPLAYYYHGPGRIVAVPSPVDFHSYDVARFVVHNQQQLRTVLNQHGNPDELWLVTAGACHSLNVHYGCNVVETYVSEHYQTLKERTFYHAEVRLLRRSPGAQAYNQGG
jgi:uncharacterized membrane protein